MNPRETCYDICSYMLEQRVLELFNYYMSSFSEKIHDI